LKNVSRQFRKGVAQLFLGHRAKNSGILMQKGLIFQAAVHGKVFSVSERGFGNGIGPSDTRKNV
jgi:hypothetical protein